MKKFTEINKQITEEKKNIEILPTGFNFMDSFLDGGFLKKEMIVLGGKTGGGKSFFAGNIFYHLASKGNTCAYFSLEISNQMIVSRLIGARSDISPTKIMIKMLSPNEEEKKNKAYSEVSVYDEFMYFYDDIYQLELIEKEVRLHKYDFIVIDFIQNVMSKQTEEYERLSYVSLKLQKLAKENNTCILVLSQLSNQFVRDRKNNDIVEYKGSGAIGHAADLGLFIENNNEVPGYFSVRIRKNRRGISGQSFSFQILQPGGKIIESII